MSNGQFVDAAYVDGYTSSSGLPEDYEHLKPDVKRDIDRLTVLRGAPDDLEHRLWTLGALQDWASEADERRTIPEEIRRVCGYHGYEYKGGHIV